MQKISIVYDQVIKAQSPDRRLTRNAGCDVTTLAGEIAATLYLSLAIDVTTRNVQVAFELKNI